MSAQPRPERPAPPPSSNVAGMFGALHASHRELGPELALTPRILCTAIALQGRELENAWRHGVDAQALEQRVCELLCDVLELSDALKLDLDDALQCQIEARRRRHLRA
jgi:hypothetical protein